MFLPVLDAWLGHFAQRMIAFVPRSSTMARMILTHQTHFCELFRFVTTASSRKQLVVFTSVPAASLSMLDTKDHSGSRKIL